MHGYVVKVDRLTPSMVRVVLGGGDLAGFAMVDATDAYVNLAFRPPTAPYGEVFDPRAVKESAPREQWPARRRYTVRRWDAEARELTLDFVVHGDDGVAGRWALSATPGDVLVLEGPAGGYRPSTTAGWHLLLGDESALPAVAASLEALPDGAEAVVRLVCDGPDHEVALPTPPRLDLRWLHRSGTPDGGGLLLESLRATTFPAGDAHAFVHGEAEEIRGVRRHLLQDRGFRREQMSCSPYWRRTMADEAWREVKRDFVTAMESDVA
jgi:NADPH-dependent ferric siderophore reductase